jgi:2,5-diketo-D-gluconate reductase A
VILRWHLQIGNVVIPKSVTPSRIAENLDVFGFALDAGDIATIEAMDRGARIGPDPDVFNRGA